MYDPQLVLWSLATDRGSASVQSVLFDLRNAVDLVNHGHLVEKMKKLQLSTLTLNCIIEFSYLKTTKS